MHNTQSFGGLMVGRSNELCDGGKIGPRLADQCIDQARPRRRNVPPHAWKVWIEWNRCSRNVRMSSSGTYLSLRARWCVRENSEVELNEFKITTS